MTAVPSVSPSGAVRRAAIVGVGAALPSRVVSNDELAREVDTTDAWIIQRTGIRQRRLVSGGETTGSLALAAARDALSQAGLSGSDLDAIVLATTTPDQTFPATAVTLQAELGMRGGFAFDVQAVCTGFVYALAVADNFVTSGQARRVLVVGAESFSRLLDWQDRGTCVLFGDGAGAVVLEAVAGTGTARDRGILSTHLHSDGHHRDLLYVDGGPATTGTVGKVRMNGREVFKHAVTRLAEVVDEALGAHDLDASAIDWLIPHQANRRIIEATARKLDMASDRVVVTVDQHANTSAASIPLAFATAVRDGRIQPGHLLLLEGMGGGLTWGAALVRF